MSLSLCVYVNMWLATGHQELVQDNRTHQELVQDNRTHQELVQDNRTHQELVQDSGTLILVEGGVQGPLLASLELLCSVKPAEAGEVGCFTMPLLQQ